MIVALHSQRAGVLGRPAGVAPQFVQSGHRQHPAGPRPDGVRRLTSPLELLTDELSATPAHLPGDRRPLAYQLAQP